MVWLTWSSVPTTPATTPPGNAVGGVPQYPTTQGYDGSRSVYTAPPTQTSPYSSQIRYSQYPKTDMAPPARAGEEPELKQEMLPGAPQAEVEDQDQGEYTHTSAPYSAPRDPFGYGQGNPSAYQPSPADISSSPSHPNGSGRATPRTASNISSYAGPQRTSSTLYNVIGDSHGAPPAVNGAPDTGYASHGYPPPYANGVPPSGKRGRDDDEDYRPDSRTDMHELKRRKTAPMGGAVGSPYDKNIQSAKR